VKMMDTNGMSEAELADYYDRTHDISGFDLEHPEPITPARGRLDVTISVRFSSEEIDLLRAEAERAGMKVTAFIRALALQHASGQVLDRAALRGQLARVSQDLRALEHELGAWLADPEHAAEMAESAEAIRQGRALSLDEVRAQLASRR